MTREEKSEIVEKIRKKILEATNFAVMSETDLEDAILQMLDEMFQDVYIPIEEKADITDQVYRTNMVANQVFGSSFSYAAGTENGNGKMFK